MANSSEYQRTPARWRGLSGGGSVWLANDHLLSVQSTRYSEEYKRYYYHDIQALLFRQGERLCCPVWIYPFALVFVLLALSFSASNWFGSAALCVVSILSLIGFVVYQSLFQCCFCYVVTAVGTEELSGMRRVGGTRKAIALIAARVTDAQGALHDGWEQSALIETEAAPRMPWGNVLQAQRPNPTSAQVRGVWAALLALLCTLLDALFTIGQSRHSSIPNWVGMTNVSVGAIGLVTAIVLLRNARHFYWLRNIALAGVICMGGCTYLGYLLSNISNGLPPAWRGSLSAIARGTTFVNITGDLVIVVSAVVLWMRHRVDKSITKSLTQSGGV